MADSKMVQTYLWKLTKENQMISTDTCDFIVAAPTEKSAREMANQNAGSEGYAWLDGSLVVATRLGTAEDGVYGVILRSSEEQ
jgi:hypothetical protein